MIRTVILLAALIAGPPAHAKDMLMLAASSAHAADDPPMGLHCTMEGKPFADLRKTDGHYHLRMAGKSKWSKLHDNAVGMGIVMLVAGGAKCEKS